MTRLAQLKTLEPRITAGDRAGFGEAVGAGYESARITGTYAEGRRHMDVYGGWRPLFDQVIQGYLDLPEELGTKLATQGFSPDEETLGELAAWVEGDGAQHGYKVTDDMQPAAVMARREKVYGEASDALSKEEEILSRAGPASRVFGGLVGGVAAEFSDPLNLATMPLGAPARIGLLGTMLIEAGINAAIEGADTANRNAIAERLGGQTSSVVENMTIGALFGGTLAGIMKGGAMAFSRIGRRDQVEKMVEFGLKSDDEEIRALAEQVRRDVEERQDGNLDGDDLGDREHLERAQAARTAAETGDPIQTPERPTFTSPRMSILAGEIEEVSPRDLEVQPEVFQFKSDAGEGGVTAKLKDVTEWRPERAGISLVYEYADGTRAIADGHQRTALATRIMDAQGGDIRLAARVYREADGFSVEDVRVLAALKNIAEAADGMTTAMARDAAKVLRVRPDAITELPAGPGIARAQALSRLSDDAFDLFINEVVPERFAELVGRMVENPEMHTAVMRLLERVRPETTAQAESVIAQALEAPTSRETTADLFGEREVVESLFLERAKVLERALRLMRDERSIFKTLDDSAGRIEAAGNRLDVDTNKRTREQTEQALAVVKSLAHRAGPIAEALNDGAQTFKANGRLKDAAQRVVDAVRDEVGRNGLAGPRAGDGRQAAKPAGEGATAPDPAQGFADPVAGEGVKAQIAATRIEPREDRITRLPELKPAEAMTLEMGLRNAQAIKDLDDLMTRGAANHAELTREIASAAQEAGVIARAAPLKGADRIKTKVQDKYAGDWNRITDVARGGVDAATPEVADRFVEILSRRYRIVDEGWNLVDGGYFDRKLSVVFDDGQLGEVQIWVPGMFEVKEAKGHKLYEVYRDSTRSDAERAEALAEMEKLYQGVLDNLPPVWGTIFDQDAPGMAAPRADTASMKSASDTSGEPSSASTSRGSMGDQSPDLASSNIEPGSGSTAGMSRSTIKKRIPSSSQDMFDGIDQLTETAIGDDIDLRDAVPVGLGVDDEGNQVAIVKTRDDLAAELDADEAAADVIEACARM